MFLSNASVRLRALSLVEAEGVVDRERLLLDLGLELDLGTLELHLGVGLDLRRNRSLGARRLARRAPVFQLAMRAGVAVRADAFPLAMRARVAVRAIVFQLTMRAGVAVRAPGFQLAMRAGVAVRAPVLPLAMRTPFIRPHRAPKMSSSLRPRQEPPPYANQRHAL